MASAGKKTLIGCGGILGFIGLALALFVIFSGPGSAPPHPFDTFQMDGEACYAAFNGKSPSGFDHIWVLKSQDLKAWWGPNGMRAEAEMLIDSGDPKIINEVLAVAGSASASPNHVQTLSKGRIYHILLFNKSRSTYAHLRFEYRSKQRNGETTFYLVTDFNGAHPVKDTPEFLAFEQRRLQKE